MSGHLLAWATSNSGLISVAGALIIFFSWAITNTLVMRYNRIKAATESAQSTFRLYTTLHEQRNQLNSIAMEVIQRSEAGMNASIFGAGRTGDPLLNEARQQYSRDRLSAHQVKELMEFTAEAYSLSRAVGKSSPTSQTIQNILEEVEPVYRKLTEFDRNAARACNDQKLSAAEIMRTVKAYSDYYRSEALPQVPGFYQRIVDASNIRRKEASDHLDSAKSQAQRASRAAVILYILGSVLALSGQAIEKAKPKDATPADPAAAQATSSPSPVTK
jgi:hypothetical protein